MTQNFPFIATAAFGLEGVVARELRRLGLEARGENGGARFEATPAEAYRAALCLRTADRVVMVLAEAEVQTFEDVFRMAGSVAWEKFLPRDAKIHVSGKCVRSQLMSVRDCQSVCKKAIVNRMLQKLRCGNLPESGAEFPIDLAIVNDHARLTLDFCGEALNRRGYRTWNGEAPIRETLAAALVDLSPYRNGMRVYDPCCGTGTLLIESAIKACSRPAGIRRSFACERYPFLSDEEKKAVRAAVEEMEKAKAPFAIAGSDIDPEALKLCRRHITQAGFEGRIDVHAQDLRALTLEGTPGLFLCNPPYGERLGDREKARELYREMGLLLKRHPGWSLAAITADPGFERAFGRRADKKNRLYNGRLECEFCIFK